MSRRLLILLALLLAAIMVSGCCCCCGGRKFYSPGTYPTTYRVTIIPATEVLTPQAAVDPAVSQATDIASDVVLPGQ
jgi:hypothetical protein